MVRIGLVLAVVVAATVLGRWWQSRQGRVRTVAPADRRRTGASTQVDRSGRGERRIVAATLVSTSTCRTCPQVRTALAAVATASPTFTWDEVDAAGAPDVVRSHDVRRAPTVLFRDADGRVVARAAGAMGAGQVADAVGVDMVAVT